MRGWGDQCIFLQAIFCGSRRTSFNDTRFMVRVRFRNRRLCVSGRQVRRVFLELRAQLGWVDRG